jgi:tellurite resistance protein TehA-like permease
VWAFATWWIPLLVIMGAWRHGVRRSPLRYDPQYWALVFPIGMYSVATVRMVEAVGLGFGAWIGSVAFWVGMLAWSITAIALVRAERPRISR